MDINLGEGFYIKIDTLNHTLIKHIPARTKKDGLGISKARDEVLGYFKDVPSALRGLLRFEIASSELQLTLKEYEESLCHLWAEIEMRSEGLDE